MNDEFKKQLQALAIEASETCNSEHEFIGYIVGRSDLPSKDAFAIFDKLAGDQRDDK